MSLDIRKQSALGIEQSLKVLSTLFSRQQEEGSNILCNDNERTLGKDYITLSLCLLFSLFSLKRVLKKIQKMLFILPEKLLSFSRFSNFWPLSSPLFSTISHYWIFRWRLLKINPEINDVMQFFHIKTTTWLPRGTPVSIILYKL